MSSQLIIAFLFTLASAITSPITGIEATTRAAKVDRAFQTLDSDWDTLRDLYADNALLKFCWGGENAGCVDGNVEEILYPFHRAIKTFKVKTQTITGENDQVLSIYWNNYMETPDGCGQVTSGIATYEFDENGKVVKHYSLSDDPLHCVPNYLASIEQEASLN